LCKLREEIKAFVTVIVVLAGFGQMLQMVQPGFRRVDGRDKFQIPFVNRLQG